MPFSAAFNCPVSEAPVTHSTSNEHAKLEEKIPSQDVPVVSLAASVPEMYRRTLTAMIQGHKVSALIPLPLVNCCSHKAIDASTEISKAAESDEMVEDFPNTRDGEDDKIQQGEARAELLKFVSTTTILPSEKQQEQQVEEKPPKEPTAEEKPVEVEEKPTEETQVEEKPPKEPLEEEKPAEEAKVEEKPAEEPTIEEKPAEEAKMEPPKEPKAEEKPTEVAKIPRKGLGARITKWLGCTQASAAQPKSLKSAKNANAKATKKTKSSKP
jgi:hypothetical protein